MAEFTAGALAGFLLAALLTAAPIWGMRRYVPIWHWPWQEISVCAVLATATAVILGRMFCADAPVRTVMLGQNLELAKRFAAACEHVPNPSLKRRVWLSLSRHMSLAGALIFFFLYSAAIALCQRMHVGTFEQSDATFVTVYRTAGLFAVIVGAALQIKAVLFAFGRPLKNAELTRFCSVFRIRHPVLLGWLIILCGLPAAFGTWLPLLAIPGSYVAIDAQVKLWESTLQDQFGQDYTRFQSGTWRLVPFISW